MNTLDRCKKMAGLLTEAARWTRYIEWRESLEGDFVVLTMALWVHGLRKMETRKLVPVVLIETSKARPDVEIDGYFDTMLKEMKDAIARNWP